MDTKSNKKNKSKTSKARSSPASSISAVAPIGGAERALDGMLRAEPKLSDYEMRVLAATPGKALAFLNAVSTKVEIRALLFAAGYSQQEQDVGWALLYKATGYVPALASAADDAAARAAVIELDEWDEPGLRRVKAALERLHPPQYEFVFAGLEAAQGAGAVLSVSTLLDRLDQLESGVRQDTIAADQAAIATLTGRGITPKLRAHLRERIVVAQSVATPQFPSDPLLAEHNTALLELSAWYKDWSQTARSVITRKDYLIMLGLSKRRVNKDDSDEVADTEVPAPALPLAPSAQAVQQK